MKSKKQTAAEKMQQAEPKTNDYWASKIRKAIALDDEIKGLKEELDAIKEEIKGYFGENKSENRLVTSEGAAILKVTNSYSIKPESIPELKRIYGDEYPVFVAEKIAYSPTTALRNLLRDGDYHHRDTIREATEIKTTYSVQFEKTYLAN
jgi:hypothetical protein